jgi:serpin B
MGGIRPSMPPLRGSKNRGVIPFQGLAALATRRCPSGANKPVAIFDMLFQRHYTSAIDELTRFVIANAIYFKGKWETPFGKSDTQDEPFYAEGKTPNMPMMVQRNSHHRYAEADGVQILEKPYIGGDVSMLIVLPPRKPGALSEVEEAMTADKLQSWIEALQTREVHLYLPRFKIETAYNLIEPLKSLGIQKAFSMNDADFSGIKEESEPLWIGMVFQKTSLQVDEEGTIAVAALGMGGMGGIMPKPPPIPVFRADHPFLFLIRDTRTGSILFMGRMMEP